MNVLSLFDGISCGQIALKQLQIPITNYFASEIDKSAIKVTQYNHPNTIQLGDIRNLSFENGKLYKNNQIVFEGDIDLLIAGSPCQGFSFAGKQLNFNDPRSSLFFEFERLLNEIKPKHFLLENNPMKKEYEEIINNRLGYIPYKINSSEITFQNRKRLYWTNIEITPIQKKEKLLKELVGEYEGIWVYPRGLNKGGIQKYKGKCPTITISNWEHNFKLAISENNIRKFSATECEIIQTLPIDYTKIDNFSDNKRIKLIGNGWSVEIIKHIFSFIK